MERDVSHDRIINQSNCTAKYIDGRWLQNDMTNKEATEPMGPDCNIDVITSKV